MFYSLGHFTTSYLHLHLCNHGLSRADWPLYSDDNYLAHNYGIASSRYRNYDK